MRYNTILQVIGNTPLVRLNVISAGLVPEIFAKLEFLNPGGSIKDRIGLKMVEDAEKKGKLKKGYTVIESTGAGNTGIGLAIVAATRGYRVIFTMPDKNSFEKINLLKAYGAEVIICPTDVAPDDPRSYYKVAERLAKEIPNSFFARQYYNPSNPETHYLTTGPEIWEQTEEKVTHVVAAMGTGGTISGIGKFLKEKNPKVQIIGVDPVGSIFCQYFKTKDILTVFKTYKVEGAGEDFLPSTMDFSLVDDVVSVSDKEAFITARQLARKEGILAGGTSGLAMFAAIKVARKLKKGLIVVIFPDSGKSYLSKFYNDQWMKENGFL